jgi:ATP-dependent DNA ligase
VSLLEFGMVPMLARPVSTLPAETDLPGGCVYEPKFDGYRAMLFMAGGRCRIQSRHGHDITSAFPDIVAAAEIELPDGVVVDGEMVVWGEDAHDFIQVQRRITGPPRVLGLSPASFIAFDLLMWDDDDLRGQTLTERRAMLEVVLVDHLMPFQVVPQTTDRAHAAEWMREYSRNDLGIEGLVVKGRDTPYTSGRRDWLKLRFQDTAEAVVCAVVGTLERPERLVLGVPGTHGYDVVGWTHPVSAKQQADVAELVVARDEAPEPRIVAAAAEIGRNVFSVQPTLVVETSHLPERDGLRWPVFELVRVRPDLGPDEVGHPVA